jgi:membrane fusion protein, multidrug efflux system
MRMSMMAQKITATKIALSSFLSKRLSFKGAVLLMLVACLQACTRAPADDVDRVIEEDPVALVVSPIQEKAIHEAIYGGTIQAWREVDLAFPQSGRLVHRSVKVGQRVAVRGVIAKQDSAIPVFRRRAVLAQRAGRSAILKQAEKEAQRAKQLLSEQFVSTAYFEQLKTRVDELQAGWVESSAEHAIVKKQQGDTVLYAPFSGVVMASYAEPGQMMSAGQPVIRLADAEQLDAVFSISEAEYSAWSVGMVVHFTVLSDRSRHVYMAKVREIQPLADTATHSFKVKASILKEENKPISSPVSSVRGGVKSESPPRLALGTSIKIIAEVSAQSSALSRYRVPMGAIYQQHQGEQQTPIVWLVLESRRVLAVPVRLISYYPMGVVVEANFPAKASIVAVGAQLLKEGQLVRSELWPRWKQLSVDTESEE